MTKPDFTLKFIKTSDELRQLADALLPLLNLAIDIETINWWNRHQERIALIQIAFRSAEKIRVVVIDALSDFNLEPLRLSLEQSSTLKIIHNAAFDAARLEKHYSFKLMPIFDTMAAARRSGERKYSLKAQAEIHLSLRIDKSAQSSDWSRRPLSVQQLHYAAFDPYATLLLYENQTKRNLDGKYGLKSHVDFAQNLLPLDELPLSIEPASTFTQSQVERSSSQIELTEEASAILGIISELPSRYNPNGLAASIGSERIGLAGWIIDQRLGAAAEPDEETVKLAIADLCEKGLVRITESQRMTATELGERLWQKFK